ncbi:MAG TPA: hypothetical protein VKA14_04565 [Gammaproteobacteria bacterium]|nr:hypothetical protein [Gammaproteobacteria bacterium]
MVPLSYKRLINLLAATLLALAAPLAMGATAGNAAAKQIKTAAEHAGYAAGSKELSKVHLHLHHVINCLEGASGPNFDASAGDPCKGMGSGGVADLKAAGQGSGKAARATHQALALARIAVGVDSYDAADSVARAVHGLLEQADRELAGR